MIGCAEAPEFSILTPAYNAAPYIGASIASVLAQTYDNFEMIIVDDGSTDDTAGIAESFARQDSRIRVFRQANAGVAAARNTAMRVSRGRAFALIDSDDCWADEFLRVQHDLLQSHPELDVISANAFNRGGRWDGQPWKPAGDALKPISLADLLEVEDSLCITAVFRREVADTVGGFDAALRHSEDYDFWLRALLAGYRCAFYSRPLATYRRRPDSLTGNEEQSLTSVISVLRKTQPLCAGRPEELAIIERKIRSFESRRLIIRAKSALLEGNFLGAAETFEVLEARHGSPYGVIATLTRHAPRLVRWAYLAKSTISPRVRSLPPPQ